MKKSTILTAILTVFVYFIFLSLYLLGLINDIAFIFSLAIVMFILILFIILLFILRKKFILGRIALSTGILFILFCYEFPLMLYPDGLSHYAYGYVEPEEIIAGSGIYSVGVEEFQFVNMKSKKEVEQFLRNENIDVLTIEEISNKIIYGVKNRQLLTWFHLQKEHSYAEMKDNVISYLGDKAECLERYFAQPNRDGDSAGLSLALGGHYEKRDFQNQLSIAVTGAINEKGEVFEIGVLKEKIQIIEKAGIPYLIIPSKNAKEVEGILKNLKANVEIFDVSTVDEAVHVIKELNEKN